MNDSHTLSYPAWILLTAILAVAMAVIPRAAAF